MKKLFAIFIILLVLLLALMNVFPPNIPNEPQDPGGPYACTMDAKICPDGSAVGRTGPKCEFQKCPGE